MNWKDKIMGPVLITSLDQLKPGDLISYKNGDSKPRWCIVYNIVHARIEGNYRDSKQKAMSVIPAKLGSIGLNQGLEIRKHAK